MSLAVSKIKTKFTLLFVLLFCVSVVFSDMRIGLDGLSLSVSSLLSLMLTFFFLMEKRKFFSLEAVKATVMQYGMSMAFIAVFLVATIATGTIHAWGIFIEWIFLPFFITLLYKDLLRKHFTYNIIRFLLLSVVMSSIPYLLYSVTTYDGRFFGLWPSPNHLALFIAPLLVALFFIAQTHKNIVMKICDILIFFLGLFILYQTQSVASMGAVVGGISFGIIFLLFQSLKKVTALFFIGLCTVILFFVMSISYLDRVQTFFSDIERSSLSSRQIIWQSSMDMIRESPLVGIGVGAFQENYLLMQKFYKPYLEWAVPHPHNLIMTVWLYGGFGALLFFVVFLSQHVWHIIISVIQKNTSSLIFGSAFIVIILQGVLDTPYFRIDLAYLFWFLYFAFATRKNHLTY